MNFTLNRDRTVVSTLGHSVEFKKGVPTYVPPELYAEVSAVGAMPEHELTEEEVKKTAPAEPADPAEREAAVFAAFEGIMLRGRREDFTAGGAPHPKVLAQALGWTLHNKERDILWAKFRAGSED